MTQQTIHQLIYVSTYNSGRVDSALTALRDIVTTSKRNNTRVGITGYLVFDGSGFLQILEGERAAVSETYARIERDPRHRDTRILAAREVAGRAFGAWAMAGYMRQPREAALFARHGLTGSIAQANLAPELVVALANELASTQPETNG